MGDGFAWGEHLLCKQDTDRFESDILHQKYMIEVLNFIFSSFWIWLGTAMLIGVILNGIANIVSAIKE